MSMSTDSDEDAVSRRGFLRAAAGGTAVAGTAGQVAAQEGNETTTGGGNQTSGGGGGAETVSRTVAVGPNGNFVFEPTTVTVTPGSTVTWKWKSDNHNIVVASQPEAASWKGTAGPPSKTYSAGHTYSHTFDVLGTYDYYCNPHRQVGMKGTVEVVESISTPTPGGGPPEIPDSAKTLGIATFFGLLSTLGLAYFFMKYGGDYETPEE